MLEKILTRRQFFGFVKISFLFFLNSCSNSSKKIKIALQSSFYPKSLKDNLPASWQQENINFGQIKLEKNKEKLSNSDFTLINDGWINNINFENYQNINNLFLNDILNKRSKDFLNSFREYQINKLFPIGLVPYAVIIKNNRNLVNEARKSWDFLLAEKLKGKILLPQSPRIIISISKKIGVTNSLSKLKEQAMLLDDQNSLNWLINSDASVAILPYTLCIKYLKFDSRLSIIFPEIGVPLMWHFILSKSKINNQILINWIKSLEEKEKILELLNEGWYLPYKKNKYYINEYSSKNRKNSLAPSKICWENSWSLSPMDNKQKLNLENLWNKSLAP